MAGRRPPQRQPRLLSDNLLVYGDNLRVLRESPFFRDESVDLIYLDPPFKPNEKYNVLFRPRSDTGGAAQVRAFEDSWEWGNAAKAAYHDVMENAPTPVRRRIEALRTILDRTKMFAYLCMMAPRLVEMHRVLRDTGSIYLHCDPAASHYLKLLMDGVFGPENFRNEVVWKRTGAHSGASRWGPSHDSIFFYTKTSQYTWNKPYRDYDTAHLKKFKHVDEQGQRFSDEVLTGPGKRGPDSASAQPWGGGYDPTAAGRHWQPASYAYTKYQELTGDDLANYPLLERLDKLNEAGLIFWPSRGKVPRLKRYLHDQKGAPAQDIWTDIDVLNSRAAERLGYPTQKPEPLLKRIIEASSNKGDVVLDPFCGCGTTIAAAQSAGRKWMGIDIAHDAIRIIRDRLSDVGLKAKTGDYEVWGDPESVPDAIALANEDSYQFQWWAVRRLGAREIDYRRGADKGVDGRLVLRAERLDDRLPEAIIQVKAGIKSNRGHVATLIGDVQGENVELGVLVTRGEPTKAMRETASRMGEYTDGKEWYPRIQLLTAEDIINGKGVDYPATMLEEKKPAKKVAARETQKRTTRKTT